MYCPWCGDPLERQGRELFCTRGEMYLSLMTEKRIRELTPEAEVPVDPRMALSLFCPHCGRAANENLYCSSCRLSLRSLIFELVEIHPHKGRHRPEIPEDPVFACFEIDDYHVLNQGDIREMEPRRALLSAPLPSTEWERLRSEWIFMELPDEDPLSRWFRRHGGIGKRLVVLCEVGRWPTLAELERSWRGGVSVWNEECTWLLQGDFRLAGLPDR